MSGNPKIRQSNIEWLRIVCMFMIVVAHSVTHGGYGVFPHSFNGVFALVATQGARIAVNIFVFISGYFSVGKSFSASKVGYLYIQMWTYSVLITVVLMLFGFIPASARTLLKAITPFASSQWWFATCYLLLLLIAPALQIFIKYAEQRTFTLTLAVSVLLLVYLSTISLRSSRFLAVRMVYFRIFAGSLFTSVSLGYFGKDQAMACLGIARGSLHCHGVNIFPWGRKIRLFAGKCKILIQ